MEPNNGGFWKMILFFSIGWFLGSMLIFQGVVKLEIFPNFRGETFEK